MDLLFKKQTNLKDKHKFRTNSNVNNKGGVVVSGVISDNFTNNTERFAPHLLSATNENSSVQNRLTITSYYIHLS